MPLGLNITLFKPLMEFIHKSIYINLDKREDRRNEIEEQFRNMDISAERFSEIERRPGIVGCTASHLAVVKRAKEEGWPNVLVFEDDFMFLVDKLTLEENLRKFFSSNIKYDVLLLAYYIEQSEPLNDTVSYAREAAASAAYVVNHTAYDELIKVWEWALENLISTGMHWLYANDQSWKHLQKTHTFLYFNTRIGKQRPSWSDNGDRYVDYENA